MKNIFKNWNNLRNGSFSLKISKYSGPKIAHHSNISSSLYETWSVKVNKNEDIGLTKIATKLLSGSFM